MALYRMSYSFLRAWKQLNSAQIFGVATALWGLIVLVLLPDSIASAKFLTEEEKNYQEQQVATAGTGVTMSTENKWKMEQVFECLRDPKTWFYFSISLLCMVQHLSLYTLRSLHVILTDII